MVVKVPLHRRAARQGLVDQGVTSISLGARVVPERQALLGVAAAAAHRPVLSLVREAPEVPALPQPRQQVAAVRALSVVQAAMHQVPLKAQAAHRFQPHPGRRRDLP